LEILLLVLLEQWKEWVLEQNRTPIAPFTMGYQFQFVLELEVALVMDWHYGFKALSDLVQSGAK